MIELLNNIQNYRSCNWNITNKEKEIIDWNNRILELENGINIIRTNILDLEKEIWEYNFKKSILNETIKLDYENKVVTIPTDETRWDYIRRLNIVETEMWYTVTL